MSKNTRLRAYVGPATVQGMTERFKEAGFADASAGTEHVSFTSDLPEGTGMADVVSSVRLALLRKHKSTFGLTHQDFRRLP